jgi:hypothetical protein
MTTGGAEGVDDVVLVDVVEAAPGLAVDDDEPHAARITTADASNKEPTPCIFRRSSRTEYPFDRRLRCRVGREYVADPFPVQSGRRRVVPA